MVTTIQKVVKDKDSKGSLVVCDQEHFKKMKVFIKDFFINCDKICSFLWIWSHLLKKSLIGNFIFCAVQETFLSTQLQAVICMIRLQSVQVEKSQENIILCKPSLSLFYEKKCSLFLFSINDFTIDESTLQTTHLQMISEINFKM